MVGEFDEAGWQEGGADLVFNEALQPAGQVGEKKKKGKI